MKTLFALLLLVSTAAYGASWYEGGTLHKSGVLEWQKASHRNKLATAADFVVTTSKHQISMDTVLTRAVSLVSCINEATTKDDNTHLNTTMFSNQTVTQVAAFCIILTNQLR